MDAGTMTISIPADQLVFVPEDGLALATVENGSVLLQIRVSGLNAVWFMLSPKLARWLTEELATR